MSEQKTANARIKIDWQFIAFWMLVVLVAGVGGYAIGALRRAGTDGLIFLAALFLAGLLMFGWMMYGPGRRLGLFPDRNKVEPAAQGPLGREQVLLDALPEPALITDKNGAPVAANASYRLMASGAGQLGESSRPPGVDRLFGGNPGLNMPIFRLARAAQARRNHEETLPAAQMRSGGPLAAFNVAVCPIPGGLSLWRLFERDPNTTDGRDDARAVLLEGAPVGFFSARTDGRIVYMNESLRELIGVERGGEHQLHLRDFVVRDAQRIVRRSRKTKVESILTRIKGKEGPEKVAAILTTWPENEPDGLCRSVVLWGAQVAGAPVAPVSGSTDEVASLTGLSLALLEESPFAAAALDGSDPATAIIEDANGGLMELSKGLAAPGRVFADLFIDEEEGKAGVVRKLKAGMNGPVDLVLGDENKTDVRVFLREARDGRLLVFVLNIADVKKLEERLNQSEKMDSIGSFAANIAHDFNNILQIILNNTELLLRRHLAGDPSFIELNRIHQTSERGAEVVRMLLAYSRRQTLKRQPLELGAFLTDMSVMLQGLVGEQVKVSVEIGRDVPYVRIDRTALERAMMNLATNARDAMAGKGGGELRIRAQQVTHEHAHAENLVEVAPGDYALIEVTDTGSGIPPELMQKIFEPFFTTKESGKGTGFGLAGVFGLIRQADGYIFPLSKVGKGTTFRIYLPAMALEDAEDYAATTLKAVAAARNASAAADEHRPTDLAGRGRILLVEDEEGVRGIAAQQLQHSGYEVIEAEDGEEALGILQEESGTFDLIISDVVMPGMDGPALLKAAKPHLGRARVLFISGYAEREFARTLDDESRVAFLPKPFTLKQLLERVKIMMSEHKRAS